LALARWQVTSWFVSVSTLILDLVIGTLTLWIYRLLRRGGRSSRGCARRGRGRRGQRGEVRLPRHDEPRGPHARTASSACRISR
jgi:hypothetical protein